jgi:hypothetical protein
MIIQILSLIASWIELIPTRNPSCHIQPRRMESANSNWKLVIENLGPGPAHDIKLRTFGMKSIEVNEKKQKMKIELGLSQADGPLALKQDESGDYIVPWTKYKAHEYPFVIEWRNPYSKKTKSVWVFYFNREKNIRKFIPVKNSEIRRMFEEIFMISIFKRKDFIKYDPHLLPKEKD